MALDDAREEADVKEPKDESLCAAPVVLEAMQLPELRSEVEERLELAIDVTLEAELEAKDEVEPNEPPLLTSVLLLLL